LRARYQDNHLTTLRLVFFFLRFFPSFRLPNSFPIRQISLLCALPSQTSPGKRVFRDQRPSYAIFVAARPAPEDAPFPSRLRARPRQLDGAFFLPVPAFFLVVCLLVFFGKVGICPVTLRLRLLRLRIRTRPWPFQLGVQCLSPALRFLGLAGLKKFMPTRDSFHEDRRKGCAQVSLVRIEAPGPFLHPAYGV